MKARVLLAEDDADQCEVLGEYLAMEGYEVLFADSTLAVIQQLTRGPDVLLLDLNGIFHPALIRGLEALPNRPALVVISAGFSETGGIMARRAGPECERGYTRAARADVTMVTE